MKSEQYFALLNELKMDGMARYVASPKQFMTTTQNSFMLNVVMLDHKPQSVWMSQNREVGGKLLMEKIFIEFEGKGPMYSEREQSHADMLKWIEWCEKNNVRAIVIGSGHKSLHGFMLIKDQIANNGVDGRKYGLIGKGLVGKLGLKTVDSLCCEPKRLHRIPLTKRSDQNTCIPIPIDMLSDLQDIRDLEANPKVYKGRYRTKGEEKPIDEVFKMTGAGDYSTLSQAETPIYQPLNLPTGDLPKYLDNILQQKCVVKEMLTNAPIHDARVAYVAWLNFLGFSEKEALDLTDKLAEFANWEDKNNTYNRHYYVQHGIGRKYVPYTCQRLQFKGVKCVGKECPMYGK